jgi:alpha-L-fucosidase
MWFDGANGGDGYYGGARETRKIGADYYRFNEVFRFVRELQPNVTIFSGADDDSDLRWCGSRRFVARV